MAELIQDTARSLIIRSSNPRPRASSHNSSWPHVLRACCMRSVKNFNHSRTTTPRKMNTFALLFSSLFIFPACILDGGGVLGTPVLSEYRFHPEGLLNLFFNLGGHRFLQRRVKLVRSTNVTVENNSEHVYHLSGSNCTYGGYDTFPPHEIPANGTVNYSTEDNSIFYGIECFTKYQTDDNVSWVEMYVLNPVVGDNVANATYSSDLNVVTTVGAGMDNQVRFFITSVD